MRKAYTKVSSDAKSPWRRDGNDGTFWMLFSDFARLFTKVYLCRVFPDDNYRQYCIHGRCCHSPRGHAPCHLLRSVLDPYDKNLANLSYLRWRKIIVLYFIMVMFCLFTRRVVGKDRWRGGKANAARICIKVTERRPGNSNPLLYGKTA